MTFITFPKGHRFTYQALRVGLKLASEMPFTSGENFVHFCSDGSSKVIIRDDDPELVRLVSAWREDAV